MERSKYIIICVVLAFAFTGLKGDYQSAVYRSYINGNMDQWKKVIDEMNAEKNRNDEFLLELVNYQYGFIAWCIGEGKHDLAEKYLSLAEENLEYLENKSFKLSHVYSYKSAFYGFRIGLSRLRAPFLGPRSVRLARMAMEVDPQNPNGYIQYGNAQYFMPAMFGGSKSVALQYYTKAEVLMESDTKKSNEDWNYLNLLSMIAKSYTELEDYAMAKTYFEKILKIEPGFLWVKNELYPKLLNKIK
jgi:tetratricopeptide (TPR) repeat protein